MLTRSTRVGRSWKPSRLELTSLRAREWHLLDLLISLVSDVTPNWWPESALNHLGQIRK